MRGGLGLRALMFYWFNYTVIRVSLILSLNSERVELSSQNRITRFRLLLISGLPPFTIFLLKAHVSLGLIAQLRLHFLGLMLMVRMLFLRAYY